MRILLATQNAHKLEEYQTMLANTEYHIIGLAEVGLGDMDVVEDGTTFTENATKKAIEYAQASQLLTLSDDSGLVVDALDGAPGIYSARYGEPHFDDAGRRRYLLQQMTDIPDSERQARFICVIAAHNPITHQTSYVEGLCEGIISQQEQDDGHGFGYDPVFIPEGHSRTFAQLTADEKNSISHRGRAVAQLPDLLKQFQQS